MANQITKVGLWLYCEEYNNIFFEIQNRCVRATDELSRFALVIETAGQRPATLTDFRTQQLALERQTQLWELSKFEPIGTHQEEIA